MFCCLNKFSKTTNYFLKKKNVFVKQGYTNDEPIRLTFMGWKCEAEPNPLISTRWVRTSTPGKLKSNKSKNEHIFYMYIYIYIYIYSCEQRKSIYIYIYTHMEYIYQWSFSNTSKQASAEHFGHLDCSTPKNTIWPLGCSHVVTF